MSVNAKLVLIGALSLTVTACGDHNHDHDAAPEKAKEVITDTVNKAVDEKVLSGSLAHKEKIQRITLNKLVQNIMVDVSEAGATEILANTDDISANAVLKNALQHKLYGKAFSEDLIIDSAIDANTETQYLTPELTASIVMSPNYDAINFVLTVLTTEKTESGQNSYENVYSARQLVGGASSATKEENKQYWINNRIELKEKLVNGLYDIAQEFSEDFNNK